MAFQFKRASSCTSVRRNWAVRTRTSTNRSRGSMSLSLVVTMKVKTAAERPPPRSGPANSRERPPSAIHLWQRLNHLEGLNETEGESIPVGRENLHRVRSKRPLAQKIRVPQVPVSPARRAGLGFHMGTIVQGSPTSNSLTHAGTEILGEMFIPGRHLHRQRGLVDEAPTISR